MDTSSSEENDDEPKGKGINKTAKVQRYLMKMRGTGSKEKTGKKDKKDKKEKKDKKQPMIMRPGYGPSEPSKKLKEKKEKLKAEKKIEKARKKELEKERALIAAERETKRIFGRSALVVSSDSDSQSPEPPERPDV